MARRKSVGMAKNFQADKVNQTHRGIPNLDLPNMEAWFRLCAMRYLALIAALCVSVLLSGCQQTYANAPRYSHQAWAQGKHTHMAPAIHTQAPMPSHVHSVYGPNQAARIPARPLARPHTSAPTPDCAAVCVIDPRTGNILYSHNANERRQVASTQKIITALCVCDEGNLSKMVRIEAADRRVSPIRMNLKIGDYYRKGDLLQAMLTGSYNDIAMTLARDTAGSVENFAKRMNARARRMRMYDSHFVNPSGLPAEQYSTAHDMAIAACYAYNNKVIRNCINIPEYDFVRADGSTKRVNSTNRLLRSHPWVHGMKTGYTNAAGKCLISCGTKDGRAVIVVVLGSTSRKIWGESLKYLRWALGIA